MFHDSTTVTIVCVFLLLRSLIIKKQKFPLIHKNSFLLKNVMVFESVQTEVPLMLISFGALTVVAIVGLVVGCTYVYGGNPWKIVLHMHDMGCHLVSQNSYNFMYKLNIQTSEEPRVRKVRPPSTQKIPIVTETNPFAK